MTAEDLAKRVLDCLDQQQLYFRSKRPSDLTKSKQMEADLRRACREVLNPAERRPTLFGEGEPGA